MVEPDEVTDLVQRHDAHVFGAERPPVRIERGAPYDRRLPASSRMRGPDVSALGIPVPAVVRVGGAGGSAATGALSTWAATGTGAVCDSSRLTMSQPTASTNPTITTPMSRERCRSSMVGNIRSPNAASFAPTRGL